jgi:hypothetical protein
MWGTTGRELARAVMKVIPLVNISSSGSGVSSS